MDETKDMMFREEDNYKAFFQKAMKKFGISSPADLKPEDEKDFYNYVDRNYKAKNEDRADGKKLVGYSFAGKIYKKKSDAPVSDPRPVYK